jgi:ABC-type sugar transport system ATPase subunit
MAQKLAVMLEDVTCSFPGVKALDSVSLHFDPCEIHALAGENGAGKSTVLKVLSGLLRPDSGRIHVGPQAFSRITDSHGLGIRMIPQEPAIVPDLSVVENVLLGHLPRRRFQGVNWTEAKRRAQGFLVEVGLDPQLAGERAGALSVGGMQMVQVARALADRGHVFLFDEPSSSLSSAEFEKLAAVMRRLRDDGATIVYVSHRLQEVFSVCDRISILRDGKLVCSSPIAATTAENVIRLMVGRDLPHVARYEPAGEPAQVALQVDDLRGADFPRPISLTVARGEIVGLAGLVGAGRTELLETIYGVRESSSGRVFVNGHVVGKGSTDARISRGLVLVPEDRKRDGLALDLPVGDNIAMPNLPALSDWGFVSSRRKRSLVSRTIATLKIKCQGASQPSVQLSGGNQQKIVLGKWLEKKPSVLLLDEPTRGIDIGSKAEIHQILRDLAAKGMAILLASSDMTELLAVSDRVLVMADRDLCGELHGPEITEEGILRLATPQSPHAERVHAG